ncbi:MAG TPA: flagellar motor switch protein FliG [Solirubrobacteraceae bacterium]|jgi:flagellar motor switch protein FliG|nr:flagellar motor switch protein FliG [Solirubrobacteraceae bacterium]
MAGEEALPAPVGELVPATRVAGARKAAVLMAALGSERAANVLQRLGEEDLESLSVEMARLSSVGAETTDSVLGELAALAGGGSGVEGGVDFAREVIERALGPERAAELLGRLSSGAEAQPFEFLRRIPPERIAVLLRSESPQTIALVLASLHTNLAAGVLSHLPERQQPEIALRIARMGETSSRVVRQVEDALRHKLTAVAEREYASAGGPKALAGILNHADRSLERNVLENLATADKGLAEEVRGMLFVFEDIVKLDERAIQQVLREVDQKDLVLALRGADEGVKEILLANMSERGAAMLKEEMEIQPPQRKRDVDEAQSRVVAVVRKLEEAGTIVIAGEEDGEDGEGVV